ncbi:SMI1/KNR4 family protein [Paenibacillus oralis]|uniref:SMI1/KNR4 family protein n=1 Tax=Paenibacillus oralis TaxID=2490856 RepID=A0A3P3TYE5_9BACL|nr:SMI1/KNR4 family protein [Paenibacillus oralis]RRJ62736.1 SMI1/KNR4 family protein [Paenibacillus oralis]
MREDLLAQLETWHEEDKFENIVNAITEIPAEDRDYELVSHLGRALNNLKRYEEAVEQLMTVADEGQEDPLWHYRAGLAYYYLERYDEALKAFEAADRLDPGDEDTLEFLGWIREKLAEESGDPGDGDRSEAGASTGADVDTDGDSDRGSGAGIRGAGRADTSAEGGPGGPGVYAHTGVNGDLDLANFWDDSTLDTEKYVSAPPSDELIASVEEELVFKLPAFYVQMMKIHNGGVPRNRFFPLGEASGGTKGNIEITGILGIGREKKHSLCGTAGSRFRIDNEGYPEFGVIIGECPAESGVVMLDYRESGNDGEPEVVHVDKGNRFKVTKLTPSFEAFIRGLVSEV